MKTNAEIGMVNPSTDELLTKVDSRYGMVVLAAKRARQLLEGDPVKSELARSTKNVTNAFEARSATTSTRRASDDGDARGAPHRTRRHGRHRRV